MLSIFIEVELLEEKNVNFGLLGLGQHGGEGAPRAVDVVCGHNEWALTWEAEGGVKDTGVGNGMCFGGVGGSGGVGDEVRVVPFFHCLLLNGRRWWWGLAFALLKGGGVERGEFVCLFEGCVGRSVRTVCCLSLTLSWRAVRGMRCGSFCAWKLCCGGGVWSLLFRAECVWGAG